jgi:hypothetical protein
MVDKYSVGSKGNRTVELSITCNSEVALEIQKRIWAEIVKLVTDAEQSDTPPPKKHCGCFD